MSYDYDCQVGKRIQLIRKSKGLTQEMLAAKLQVAGCLHMTRSAIAKAEVGLRHLYAVDIRVLLDVLNVSADDLLPKLPR